MKSRHEPTRSKVWIAILGLLVMGAAAFTLPEGRAPSVATTVEDLGRLLFWDPILSGELDVACATCHHPDFAYADGREISLGVGAVGLGPDRVDASGGRIPVVKRNSPTVLNTAFNSSGRRGRVRRGGRRLGALPNATEVDQTRTRMFWDNRVRSLETQALEPIKSMEEMRGHAYPEDVAVDSVLARLRAIPEYSELFGDVFGASAPIDASNLAAALAAFQRSLVAVNSPFDRFRAGDEDALTEQQQRGIDAFDDAGCDGCHGGSMLSDFSLHAEGVAEHPLLAEPDSGAGRFRFRTPTLRNVALTAPYMHNGMLSSLEDVLDFYDRGRSENPNVLSARRGRRGGGGQGEARVDRRFVGVDDMSDEEMRDIIAFLEALSDEDFDRAIPVRVPSGLPVGGSIQEIP